MRFTLTLASLGAILPAGGARAATAAAAPSLELAAFRVIFAKADAPEHLVPADKARIGDLLQYVATYRNPTATVLHHVVVDVPVPATGVEYVLDTASPHADAASTDGKRFFPLPLTRTETLANGSQVLKPAPAGDYHALRWDLGDVPAGATRSVSARVTVGAPSAPR